MSTPEGDGRKLESRHAVVLATGTDPVIPGPVRTSTASGTPFPRSRPRARSGSSF
jgi:hypothetical protein